MAKITAADVNKLRKMTGAGMMDCKNALVEAEGDFDKAIDIDPDDASAYYNRAISKDNLENYQGAIEDYTKAIEIDPSADDRYHDRALSKTELGDYQGAIEDFSISIEMDPKSVYAYLCRAEIKRELKDYQGAIEDLKKIKEINPYAYDRMSMGYFKSIIRNGGDSKLIKKVMQKNRELHKMVVQLKIENDKLTKENNKYKKIVEKYKSKQ